MTLDHAFMATRRCVAREFPEFAAYRLNVGCPEIQRARAQTPGLEGCRHFMHVGHLDDRVCAATEAAGLGIDSQLGLFLHEFGHLISEIEGTGSEDPAADLAVLDVLGLRIEYSDPLRLQYLHPDDVPDVVGANCGGAPCP